MALQYKTERHFKPNRTKVGFSKAESRAHLGWTTLKRAGCQRSVEEIAMKASTVKPAMQKSGGIANPVILMKLPK